MGKDIDPGEILTYKMQSNEKLESKPLKKKSSKAVKFLICLKKRQGYLVNAALLWGPRASAAPLVKSSGVPALFWQAKPPRSPHYSLSRVCECP